MSGRHCKLMLYLHSLPSVLIGGLVMNLQCMWDITESADASNFLMLIEPLSLIAMPWILACLDEPCIQYMLR